MIFGRKYPLCYNIPWDDCGGSPTVVTKTRYIATDGKFVYSVEELALTYILLLAW